MLAAISARQFVVEPKGARGYERGAGMVADIRIGVWAGIPDSYSRSDYEAAFEFKRGQVMSGGKWDKAQHEFAVEIVNAITWCEHQGGFTSDDKAKAVEAVLRERLGGTFDNLMGINPAQISRELHAKHKAAGWREPTADEGIVAVCCKIEDELSKWSL